MSSGVSTALFSWLDLQFEVLPFPSPEPKRDAALRLAQAAQQRQGEAAYTAGEAEAAEPSTHNGSPREGEGRRLQ